VPGEEVYRELERQILLGILKPRERLVEVELCRKLGISRTLLREVFRRLEGVGLVSFSPNRGVIVRDFSEKEVEQVYFVRTVLEKAAVPLIMQRITSEDLQQLRTLNQGFEEASRTGNIAGMILSNLAFHRRIWRIADNAFLCRLLETAQLHTDQVRYIVWLDRVRVDRSVKEHREMLLALAERDRARFEEAVEKQIDGGRTDYRRIFSVQSNRRSGSGKDSAIRDERMIRLRQSRGLKR
jgi:DNA-binding GntR family transcriptional regulator